MTTSGRSSSNFSPPPGVGDVELGAAEADDVVAGIAGGEHHVAAEHPGGSCDENLHLADFIVATVRISGTG